HAAGVRAGVRRPLRRAYGGDSRGVEVGERGGGDAGGERRCVALVVRVQNQRDVERARREAARPLARQHVEEIRRVPENGIRQNRTLAFVHAAQGRDERAQLRRQPHRLAVVRRRGVVGGIGIVV